MSYSKIHCRACHGINAPKVTVEVHLASGQPAFSLVGLPETVVKESKDRVRSAILNNQFLFPVKRITVNLAPASLPKQGGRFDLAIAIGILVASKQLPAKALNNIECAGELGLSGHLHGIRGVLSWVLAAQKTHRALIIPKENADEARLALQAHYSQPVFIADHFLDVCKHIQGIQSLPQLTPLKQENSPSARPLINDVRGQSLAKKALLLAAAGGHHLLFHGPPGAGKTMLASCLADLLPPLSHKEALEVAMIKSLHPKGFHPSDWLKRPMQSPHHNTSASAMIGGGRPTSPGDISLAHHGVLFLDELPEFPRPVLEALREPIESGCIHVARVGTQMTYPARFQLIAAMNPCPCGYYDDGTDRCSCSTQTRLRYRDKLSGPLLDRIDLHCHVKSIPPKALWSKTTSPSHFHHSNLVTAISQARDLQHKRQGFLNSQLSWQAFEQSGRLTSGIQALLTRWMNEQHFSTRRILRLLRLGQTQADLENTDLDIEHLEQMLVFTPSG